MISEFTMIVARYCIVSVTVTDTNAKCRQCGCSVYTVSQCSTTGSPCSTLYAASPHVICRNTDTVQEAACRR